MKPWLLFFFSLPFSCFSQNQERQLLVYNVAFGAVSSGIGAIINKPKNSDWKKQFIKGAWQGSIGGLLNYSGKKTLYLINKKNEIGYAWPARILHAAGTSIIENAALNEPFLSNWNIDVGPVRIDFATGNKKHFKARFLPMSIYACIKAANKGTFDWSSTLRSGVITYHKKRPDQNPGIYTYGTSYGRSIIFSGTEGILGHEIFAHEVAHTFQYRDYMIINTWLKPLGKQVKSNTIQHIFSKYVYTDIPYFYPIYPLAGKPETGNHFRNFFEYEAQRMATNRYVPR